MRAKSSEKFNNQKFLEKIEASTSEYPASKRGPKLKDNKNFDFQNLNILNENFDSKPKVPLSKNLNFHNLSNKNQFTKSLNQIENNFSAVQRPKNEITGISRSMMPITEHSTNSSNDFNFNFDSGQFSSFGEYNQNQKNSSNNFEKLGIKIPYPQKGFNVRDEENFYLSNEDIVNIAMSMNSNDNTNQKTNDIFGTNNLTEVETKTDEKNPFEYNEMPVVELKDTNNKKNQFSTNEGEFTSYCKIISTKIEKPISINQSQLSSKENKKLNNIPTTSSNEILDDYFNNNFNFNSESIQKTSEFKPDLTNVIEYPSTNVNYEFNPSITNEIKEEKIIETKESFTQTESSDLVLNVSLKINPFETKVQNIKVSSRKNSENNNKLGEEIQAPALLESIDVSSKPYSQNQNTDLAEFIDTYNLETQSTFAKVSKLDLMGKNVNNITKEETIKTIKTEPAFNFDNITFETKDDNNAFVENNDKIENDNIQGNSLRYSILESSNNKDIDLANVYAIAEAELLEENQKSSKK